MRFNMIRVCRVAALGAAGIALAAVLTMAETSPAGQIQRMTATTDNVSGAHDSIRIDILQWSTDPERDQLIAAWMLTDSLPLRNMERVGGVRELRRPFPQRAAEGGAARRRRRPARLRVRYWPRWTKRLCWDIYGHRKWPDIRFITPSGYRNRTEERASFSSPIGVWASGTISGSPWARAAPANYPFSVIELHLNAKGEGEGKISLVGKVVVDSAAKTIALEDYSAVPVVLRNVKLRSVPKN